MLLPKHLSYWWLVWRRGNGVRHVNKVNLRQARLVLGLVTTYDGCTIPLFFRPLGPTQPGHPSMGSCNKYRRWFQPPLGKNGASEVTTLWRFINQVYKKKNNAVFFVLLKVQICIDVLYSCWHRVSLYIILYCFTADKLLITLYSCFQKKRLVHQEQQEEEFHIKCLVIGTAIAKRQKICKFVFCSLSINTYLQQAVLP